jgi:hypothetical protein
MERLRFQNLCHKNAPITLIASKNHLSLMDLQAQRGVIYFILTRTITMALHEIRNRNRFFSYDILIYLHKQLFESVRNNFFLY